MPCKTVWGVVFALLGWTMAWAEPPTVAQFAQPPQFDDVQISPNGKYFAARYFNGQSFDVAVFNTANRSPVSRFGAGFANDVAALWWVGPERLLITPEDASDGSDQPALTGELIGIDADGKNVNYLFGQRAQGTRIGTRLGGVERKLSAARLLRTLPDDPEHVVIEAMPLLRHGDAMWQTYRLNVYTGALSDNLVAPVPGPVRFVADRNGEVRFMSTQTEQFQNQRSFYRNPKEQTWRPVNGSVDAATNVLPLGVSPDGRRVLMSHGGKEGYCLSEQPIEGGVMNTLACDPDSVLEQIVYSFDKAEPIAVLFGGDHPHLRYIASKHPHVQRLIDLQKAFKDAIALPWSSSTDGRKLIVKVYSDRERGAWYLYDSVTNKADLLFPSYDWLYPEDMGERVAARFKSSDGFEVHAFLTKPLGYAGGAKLPLIVNVHGGPMDVNDDWSWDGEAQMLATRGYAVLQVNYRGSSGYGLRYRNAGWGQAGGRMIDDITAGTRWAIAQGIADPARICIMGGSYGAYAAVESAVREPDLYRCVAALSGFYDIPSLLEDSDTARRALSAQYVRQEFGGDTAAQRAASPLGRLNALKAPVLVVHGELDKRTPYAQAKALRAMLDEGHHPYEWMAFPGEWHGLYTPANREAYYVRLLDFLDRQIGSRSTRPASSGSH